MRGHVPTQPSSSRPASLHGHWGQSCAASGHSGAPQSCALAAAFGLQRAAEIVEMVVDPRALLATNVEMTVLLAARSMTVTIRRICVRLGRQDALLMAETRLWTEADERREREGGGANERDKARLS